MAINALKLQCGKPVKAHLLVCHVVKPQTPHSGYVTLCYFNHCQNKNHVTMLYHVIDSKLQPLFTTPTAPNSPQQLLPLISTVTTVTTSKSGSRETDLFFSLLFLKPNTLYYFSLLSLKYYALCTRK